MYIVGMIAYIAFLCAAALLTSMPTIFVDFPSIIVILVPTLALLLASGLMPDFLRGFQVMARKENMYSMLELRKTSTAVGLAIKLLPLSGFLGSLSGVVSMLATLNDVTKLGRSVSVALLTLLYSILFMLILLPIRAKVKAIMETLD